MKYVREHINEKFKEESDPVYDMGIGMIRVIQKWAKTIHGYRGNPENLLWLSTRHGKDEYVKFLLEAGIYDKSILDWSLRIAASTGHAKIFEMLLKAGADIHTAQDRCKDLVANKPALKKIWAKYVEKEKSQNKKVNEKFQLDSDPIHDLGIGIYTKRNFEKTREFVDFVIEVIPILLKTPEIPKDILRDFGGNTIVGDPYFTKIDNFLEKYITFNDIPLSSSSCSVFCWNTIISEKLSKMGYK